MSPRLTRWLKVAAGGVIALVRVAAAALFMLLPKTLPLADTTPTPDPALK